MRKGGIFKCRRYILISLNVNGLKAKVIKGSSLLDKLYSMHFIKISFHLNNSSGKNFKLKQKHQLESGVENNLRVYCLQRVRFGGRRSIFRISNTPSALIKTDNI